MKELMLIFLCIILASCASFDIAEPITPESGWPYKAVEVDSLQPVLSWEPEFEGAADLIIFKGPYTENGYLCCGEQSELQGLLYIEKNIEATEHKLKVELEPNRTYFWAVRSSKESEESEWSNYEYFAFYGIAWSFSSDQFFKFKTPSN